jgi:hypothetical protein
MDVIMVGPVREGTPRASTQEAAVCSATESLVTPRRARGDVVPAARRSTTATPLTGEARDDH